jgi:hypothetical protein
MSNNIETLRDHLFAELEALRNPDKEHNKDRTSAVVAVAQTIISSVKAETDFLRAIGAKVKGSGFIPEPPAPQPAAIAPGPKGPVVGFQVPRPRAESPLLEPTWMP